MKILTEVEAENFLEKEGFKVVKRKLTKNYKEAENFAYKVSFPVVLKISSRNILHKTENNALILNITKDTLKKSYQKLANKKEKILIQKQIPGESLIMGIKKDPTFKHTLLVGFGGVLTELIKDTSLRITPINKKEAKEMLEELKSHPLIDGFRGKKLNKEKIIENLIKVSKLPEKYPNIKELDINPLIVSEKEATIVDARIIFE